MRSIDVVLSSENQSIKIPAMDITVEGALLRFPVPLPFVERQLQLCIYIKSISSSDVILCSGHISQFSQGRKLIFSKLPELCRSAISNY